MNVDDLACPAVWWRNDRSYGNSISREGVLPKELHALGETMNPEIGRKQHRSWRRTIQDCDIIVV
jgi:hypothetical protein